MMVILAIHYRTATDTNDVAPAMPTL